MAWVLKLEARHSRRATQGCTPIDARTMNHTCHINPADLSIWLTSVPALAWFVTNTEQTLGRYLQLFSPVLMFARLLLRFPPNKKCSTRKSGTDADLRNVQMASLTILGISM
jgi:hypothetical protein